MRDSRRPLTVDNVLNDIREKIILNKFDQDQAIAENTLAQIYNVSRGTIRVALQALESEGLIVIGATGRKQPISITEEYINNLYTTRTMLEKEAAKICMQMKDFDSANIAAAFAAFYQLYSFTGDELYGQRSVINTNFHRAIVLTTKNIPLIQCWSTIEPQLYCLAKFNYITLGDRQTNDDLVESHQLLMSKIIRRDDGVFSLIESHIMQAVDESRAGLDENR